VSTEERVSYRGKLGRALINAATDFGNGQHIAGPVGAFLGAVLSVRDAELERAEAAIARARADLLVMAERCILQAGHARRRGDAQREGEWAVVAENARKILAVLSPAGGSEKEEDPNAV
jgi:hypothetical protein